MSEVDRNEEASHYADNFDRDAMQQDRARSRSPVAGGGPSSDRKDTRGDRDRGDRGDRPPRSFHDRNMASQHAAHEASRRSQKNCRVYVGNLSYGVKWNTLKDFMREAGNVVFSEVLTLPNGSSKGCGIVEYSSPEEAQKAISQLTNKELEGRQVFVREDREDEPRYGTGPGAVPRGGARAGFAAGGRGGFGPPPGRGGFFGGPPGYGGGFGAGAPTQLFVSNLPYDVSWQDLKDLFRSAGAVTRADVNMGPDGRSKGTGIVAFANSNDASNAIAMYHSYDFRGRMLEVRLDKFAGAPPMDPYARGAYGPPPRGGFAGRGGFGGRGGFAGRGGYAGGYGGGYGDPYGGYGDPYAGSYGGGYGDRYAAASGRPTGPASARPAAPPASPSQQIFVRNLPWSTSNEDLVELFQTTGKVDEAEIVFEGGRSKGVGIVQFATVEDAETAIAKFNNYVYGGRPLEIEFNRRWNNFRRGGGGGGGGSVNGGGDGDAHIADAVEGVEGENGDASVPMQA